MTIQRTASSPAAVCLRRLLVAGALAGLTACDDNQPPTSQVPAQAAPAYQPAPVYVPPPPPTIRSIVLTVVIACAPKPPPVREVYDPYGGTYSRVQDPWPPPMETAPIIGTGVTLVTENGSEVRFSDETGRRPSLSFDGDTRTYRLTIEYRPLNQAELIGQPVTDIDGFTAIIGNYGPTLAALGLDFKDVEAVSLTVNGTSVATESSVTRLGADRWSLPLSVRTASQTLSTAPGAL